MSEVLVFPRRQFVDLPEKGIWPLDGMPTEYAWRERDLVENDDAWLQPIPYLLIRSPEDHVWCYRRIGGDTRLSDRRSCGVGGHVERCDERADLASTLSAACAREAAEELADVCALGTPVPSAWLYEGLSPIGRVHIGIVYLADWLEAIEPEVAPDESLDVIGFLPLETIASDERFELWSRLAASYVRGHGLR